MNQYIKRNIEKNILQSVSSFPALLVTGPRQVGKITLLRQVIENTKSDVTFVSLDDLRIRALAKEDPELFLETYPTPVIIDEFHHAPELLPYIKMIIDKKRNEALNSYIECNGLYFLTDSQSFLSMEYVTESLAGRVAIIDLYGLSNREIIGKEAKLFNPDINELKKEKIDYEDINIIFKKIFRGSFPELYKNKNISTLEFYDSYIRTYLERDIRKIIKVKDEIKFMKFMTSLAVRTGTELNLVEIANDAEISSPTANEWLSVLVNNGLVVLLQPYSNNIIKRVVKRPKIYFMDTGLACYLAKYPNAEVLSVSSYAGNIFETYVISEIVKSFANARLNYKDYLYYYRDNNGAEIDLLIESGNIIYPIEIKKNKSPNSDSIKNFKVLDNFNKKIGNGIVLCMTNEIFPINRDNYLAPISLI